MLLPLQCQKCAPFPLSQLLTVEFCLSDMGSSLKGQFCAPGNDALEGGVPDDPLHGVGLSRRRLAVGEDGPVVTVEDILDDWGSAGQVNLLLGHVGLQDLVEHVKLALQKDVMGKCVKRSEAFNIAVTYVHVSSMVLEMMRSDDS